MTRYHKKISTQDSPLKNKHLPSFKLKKNLPLCFIEDTDLVPLFQIFTKQNYAEY